jgi:hypothetical protein
MIAEFQATRLIDWIQKLEFGRNPVSRQAEQIVLVCWGIRSLSLDQSVGCPLPWNPRHGLPARGGGHNLSGKEKGKTLVAYSNVQDILSLRQVLARYILLGMVPCNDARHVKFSD